MNILNMNKEESLKILKEYKDSMFFMTEDEYWKAKYYGEI